MNNPVYRPKGKALEYADLALNIYDTCDHGCAYCWSKTMYERFHGLGSFSKTPEVRKGVLEALEKQCKTGELDGKTVLLCFTCDPYSLAAKKTGATRRAMEIFNRYGINFTVLTKGGNLAISDFDLYKPGDAFGTTLTFVDMFQSIGWEPNAAVPIERCQAITAAHTAGIKTWVSLEPVISPGDAIMLVNEMHDRVDLWKVGKWNYDPRAKEIDWNRFGHEIEELFVKYGCDYYIKEDLRKAMTE